MGYIYLLKSNLDGVITYKIGKTNRKLTMRLKEVSTGNAGITSIESVFETKHYHKLETIIHRHFEKFHKNGEWFGDGVTKEDFDSACEYWNSNVSKLIEMENPFI
jgi:hypothetical protein